MKVFLEALKIGTYVGLWRPINLKSTFYKQLYHVYMFFALVQVVVLLITQLIFAIFVSKSIDEFIEASFFIFTSINVFVKGVVIVKNRSWVLRLMDKLMDKKFIPQNDKEEKVYLKGNNMLRIAWRFVFVFCQIVAISMVTRPLLFSTEKGELPLKAWFPVDTSSGWNHVFFYIQQSITTMLIPIYVLTPDIIIVGFMINTKVQFDFLIFRLQDLCEQSIIAAKENKSNHEILLMERKIMHQCIQHHIEVYTFSSEVNDVFSSVILIQFLTSSTVFGVTGYLVVTKTSAGVGEYVYLVLYMAALVAEFFSYCWFGTQVAYKSSNFITQMCEIDWTVMNVRTMKEILIMMMRSTSPIMFSCGPLIQLSLDTFTSILKISYSAMNLLKSTT